jgi:hypothetical protein
MTKRFHRKFKWSLILLIATTSFGVLAQEKFDFGFSLRGSLGLLTNKTQNIDQIFETLHVTKYEGKVSQNQNRLWNTCEIGFDLRLPNKKWEFSAGLRAVNWHYNRDSIIRHYPTQVYVETSNGPWPIVVYKPTYAFSKRVLSTILPFVSAGYLSELTKKSGISYTLSIGYLGLFEKKVERNFAYDENFQSYWEDTNHDLIKYKRKLNSYAFDCRISADYSYQVKKTFQLNTGLSYYYVQNGLAMHHGLYWNIGFSFRFVKQSSK